MGWFESQRTDCPAPNNASSSTPHPHPLHFLILAAVLDLGRYSGQIERRGTRCVARERKPWRSACLARLNFPSRAARQCEGQKLREVTHVRQAVEKQRQEETTKHSLACFAARSAALDLAGVPAKIEHRGQHKKLKWRDA